MNDETQWSGDLGRDWAAKGDQQDALLGRFEAAGFDALGAVKGLRVLDLGCGPGQSSFALAAAGAQVTGLDISPDLIAAAEARKGAAGTEGGTLPDFVLADAAEATFDRPFDAIFSRFGAMFFSDPVPAWRNLRAALRPGGRLVVVAWRGVTDNVWVSAPLGLVRDLLPPTPPPAPGAPGPFGWADPGFFAPMLEEAGWSDVAWTPADREIALGQGHDDPAAGMVAEMRAGTPHPAAKRLSMIEDEAVLEQAWGRIAEGMKAYVSDGAVRTVGAVWVVTARA